MKTVKIYHTLPKEALNIRITVFVDEQGFIDEVDDIDAVATHFVLFENGLPIATCRVFPKDDTAYYLGRLAVLKEYRGKSIGTELLAEVEAHVRTLGAHTLHLHSQETASPFYQKCGYTPYGEIDYEQDCPHIWMMKELC